MAAIKAHFDGTAVVLDEPASLAIGQAVRVVVEPVSKRVLESLFSPHQDPTAALMNGCAPDERDALHVDPLDRVPSDFVRKPGSGAGQIKIADDFDAIPTDFNGIV